ncbi:uncharacterized protein FMAN_14211 [Fusarium mangiferae]|uniref:Uncharacterized protein n=1 Tax=Fusarium mangiferae TaxID=192010 RepID=A0A1L7UJ99_FUSMA|nr:uncharacterized protein FMAN_14211 [Fusarium mangiferae]CVL08125.1 uncharacterized protein FMAN_14211 [Fusarium mangiferae]
MSAASRTVVCDDSMSQATQEHKHQFPITLTTLTTRASAYLKDRGKELSQVIKSLDKGYLNQEIDGIHCARTARFACNVFRAAAKDIHAQEEHMALARNEAGLPKRPVRSKIKGRPPEEAQALKEYIDEKNEAWMKETVALWRALKVQRTLSYWSCRMTPRRIMCVAKRFC